MWDIPRYRIRAYLKARRVSQAKRAEKPQLALHFKRTQAEIRFVSRPGTTPQTARAIVILNDLRTEGITVFSNQGFQADQLVQITVSAPRLFYVTGRVTYCRVFEFGSRVVSREAFPYRVKIHFDFRSQHEREAVKMYIEELSRTVLGAA